MLILPCAPRARSLELRHETVKISQDPYFRDLASTKCEHRGARVLHWWNAPRSGCGPHL